MYVIYTGQSFTIAAQHHVLSSLYNHKPVPATCSKHQIPHSPCKTFEFLNLNKASPIVNYKPPFYREIPLPEPYNAQLSMSTYSLQ